MNASAVVRLVRHPDTPNPAGCRIWARVWRCNGVLRLSYFLAGGFSRLRIAEPAASRLAAARQADDLWKHTCFEAFVSRPGSPAYHEFNFSPAAAWAAYAFAAYRAGFRRMVEMPSPVLAVRCGADVLRMDAAIRLDRLSSAHAVGPLRLGLASVIEDEAGRLSYWALAHEPGKPDFHRRACFVLCVARTGPAPDGGREGEPAQ